MKPFQNKRDNLNLPRTADNYGTEATVRLVTQQKNNRIEKSELPKSAPRYSFRLIGI